MKEIEKLREENELLADELQTLKERVEHQEIIKRLNKDLTAMNGKLRTELTEAESKLDRLSNFLEMLSMWLYKQQGQPLPQWADEFQSVCQMMDPKVKDE